MAFKQKSIYMFFNDFASLFLLILIIVKTASQ